MSRVFIFTKQSRIEDLQRRWVLFYLRLSMHFMAPYWGVFLLVVTQNAVYCYLNGVH